MKHEFQPDPDAGDLYCRLCNAPAANRRFHDIATIPIAEAEAMPADVDLIDRAIRHCLENLTEWSANDCQQWLSQVRNRNLIGQRFGRWRKDRLIEHTGDYVASTNPATNRHDVKIYRAGPNWRRRAS